MEDKKNKEFEPIPEPSYSVEKGCPFCGSDYKQLVKINKSNKVSSDMLCQICGAVFYHLENDNREIAGTFTGKREAVPAENLYKIHPKGKN